MAEWPFSKLYQIGVVVRDLDRAIEYYESIGIGPFRRLSLEGLRNKTQYGNPYDFEMRVALTQLGTVELELIQPVDSPLQQDFLDKYGEGINHVAFRVDDINAEEARLVKKGFKVVQSVRRANGGSSYFDTGKVGGVLFELYQG